MKLDSTSRAQESMGFKVKTNLKAGECCWNAFNQAQRTRNTGDWQHFVDCCNRDPNCTYFTG